MPILKTKRNKGTKKDTEEQVSMWCKTLPFTGVFLFQHQTPTQFLYSGSEL